MKKTIKKNSLLKFNLCLCASLTSSLLAYSGSVHSQQLLGQSSASLQLIAYTLQEKISVYKLATMSNLTIEQLNHLNTNMIKGRTALSKGETIYLPVDSPVLDIAKPNNTKPNSNTEAQTTKIEIPSSDTTPSTELASASNIRNASPVPIETAKTSTPSTETASLQDTQSNTEELTALNTLSPDEISKELLSQTSETTDLASKEIAPKALPVVTPASSTTLESTTEGSVNTMPQSNANTATVASIDNTPAQAPAETNVTLANTAAINSAKSTPINNITSENESSIALTEQTKDLLDEDNFEKTLPSLGSKESSTINATETSNVANYEETNLSSIVSNQLTNIANQFGNAKISVDVNEDFDYAVSDFKFLTDIIQTNNAIFFTQFGITHQHDLDRHNAITHLGFGYRHDLEDIRLGINTFVDSDLKNMSRLSVGGEIRSDYLSFSTNYYTPLDGWSSATSDERFSIAGTKQKAAKGVDVSVKGYLPSYPQLGAGLSFEQYFGDNIALFGTDNIDKDPFAVKASLDYTPIPLITANMSHRLGENNVHDSRFGIDINYRFGLSFEDQINPDLVAQLRALKGSRFDFVDRNYEIVFEYQAQAGKVNIFSPAQAFVNQVIPIKAEISEEINPESYLWLVKTPTSVIEYEQKDLALELTQEGDYQVQLQVKTTSNSTVVSNVININSSFEQNNQIVLDVVKDDALAVPELNNFSDLTNTHIVLNLHSQNQNDNHAISVPSIEWKDSSGALCNNWCNLSQSSEFMKADIIPSSNGGWEIKILGSEKLVDSSLQFKATSTVNNTRVSAESKSSARFF